MLRLKFLFSATLLTLWAAAPSARSQNIDVAEAYRLFDHGQYLKCIAACEEEIEKAWRVDWRLLKIRSQIRLGQYKESLQSTEEALKRHTGDIRVRWVARDVYRLNNQPEKAELMVKQIDALVQDTPWRYSDAEDRIVFGKLKLEQNADAKQVLELFFDTAKKVQPALVDHHIVAADLALDKNDFGLAAREAREGLKRHPENAELHFRLARALWQSDNVTAAAALEKTLKLNSNHFPALLFRAEQFIDGEDYIEAGQILDRVLEINPAHALALAHKAIIAHLEGDYQLEKKLRKQALATWSDNHWVDYTIGRKLSQKYRFREGANYQKQSLAFRPDFVPAKIQLAQDLLRLGEDEEGWKMVAEANRLDAYNVLMHNLQTLHDEIASYRTLEQDGVIVRMSVRESRLYGPEVLALLLKAKQELTNKYDYRFDKPVIVEIFPRQSDFAIRTFGMPGGIGFLGVCFGHLITANSPASQAGNPTNWQSVLWHEFCHAVTLGKTGNRMPRWLSEGISVYEERLRNRGSGERMTPTYRNMILSGELTPVSQLSAAFLKAKSPVHLQFAYYESSMVIEYLVDKHGIETVKKILVDLGAGIPVNESLQRYTGSLAELDKGFRDYLTGLAEAYGGDTDFAEADLPSTATVNGVRDFLQNSPGNFAASLQLAASLIREKAWADAEKILLQLAAKFDPSEIHPVVLELLVTVYAGQGQPEKERETIRRLLHVSDDTFELYRRLAELSREKRDWPGVKDAAERMLAVNPLQREPHRLLAEAGEKMGDFRTTSRSLECLLEFSTTDVALTRYRLAKMNWEQKNRKQAKRHVLLALEEAPRYREALSLLLEIHGSGKTQATGQSGEAGN